MRLDRFLFSTTMLRAPDAGAGAGGTGAGAGAGAAAAGAGAGAGAAGAGAGAGAEPWYKPLKLGDDAEKFIEDRKFADPVAFAKSHMEADRVARSRNVIEKPDPAKIKDWKGWTELGWEPDAAKYQIKPPAMPNGQQPDAEMLDRFRTLAHEERVPAGAAERIYHEMTALMNKRVDAITAAGAKATADLEAKLRTEWGADYETNKALAQRAAKTFGIGAEDASEIEKVLGSPRLVQLFQRIGAKFGEANLVTSDGSGGGAGALSPEAAASERRRLENDPAWMQIFRDPRHPQNADYKAQRQKLIDIEAKGRRVA